MREDMAKVIVERPRFKPRNARKGRRADLEDLPAQEGMRRGHALRGERKELNENLSPLRRYLAKQIGRPWNKVYSEISAHLRVDSTVQQHVRDHLHDFVAIKPRRNIASWMSPVRGGLWWQPYYVHPTTGLLCRTDNLPEEKARRRERQARRAPAVERIALTSDRELRRINGLWYEVRTAVLPEPVYAANGSEMAKRHLVSAPVWDAAEKKRIAVGPPVDDPKAWHAYQRLHPERRYAIAKRTLSRRELKRHGLKNDSDQFEDLAEVTQTRRQRPLFWTLLSDRESS